MIKSNGSFLVLYAKDIVRTRKFFEQLSCEIIESTDSKCVTSYGGYELHYVVAEPIEAYRFIRDDMSKSRGLMIYVAAEDLHQARSLVEQAGGTLRSPILETPWETREFLCEDPDGYHFVMYEEISKE